MTLAIATILYIAAATIIARIEIAHADHSDLTPVQRWLHEEVYFPMLRAAALLLFMLLAFRVIFGLGASSPGIMTLLNFELVSHGMNILFLLPFVFALLPNTAVLTPLLLPLQTLALTALVFSRLCRVVGVEPDLTPDGFTLLTLLILSIAGHALSNRLPALIPEGVNRHFKTSELGLIAFQLPLFLVYGRGLGTQFG